MVLHLLELFVPCQAVDIPAIISIVPKVKFVCSPLHSLALIPNNEVKNESGRNLHLVSENLDLRMILTSR